LAYQDEIRPMSKAADPNDVLREKGPDALRNSLDSAWISALNSERSDNELKDDRTTSHHKAKLRFAAAAR
jgi:hypothetical protein